jgi:hypothetical protein
MKSKTLSLIIKYLSLIIIAVLSLTSLVLNAQSWSLSGNSGTSTTSFLGTKDLKPLLFKTNKIERMRITQTGEIGIGTSTPAYPLSIINASAEIGIYIQKNYNSSSNHTGVYANSQSFITEGRGYGVQAFGGYAGIRAEGVGGASTQTIYGVLAKASGTTGTRIAVYGVASGGTTNYAIYGSAPISKADYAGYFNGFVYAYQLWQASDRKLKTEINPLQNSMEQLMKLKPSTYKYKTAEYHQMTFSDSKQMGLIADEVKQVFPELVKEQVQPAEYGKDGKELIHPEVRFDGINYIGLIPVLIASIQEQQKIISDLKTENEALKKNEESRKTENETLKARIDKIEQIINSQRLTSISKTVLLSTAHLEQNAPNPFTQNTSIKYFLPQNVSNAFIKITDATGSVLETLAIKSRGDGYVNLQEGQLTAGTYQYSLIVDGKLIDTKKMVVLR